MMQILSDQSGAGPLSLLPMCVGIEVDRMNDPCNQSTLFVAVVA